MIWTLKTLIKSIESCRTEINGNWVPARSINYKYRSLYERFHEAWLVFTGKAEAFIWPEGQ
jgi:hypothetical protein